MSARALRRIAAVPFAVALAGVLAACSTGVGTPPGPEPQIRTGPPTVTPPPDSAHTGVEGVTPQVRIAVAQAMRGYGMSIEDTAGLQMSYSADRQQITVTGGNMRMRRGGMMGGAMRMVRTVTLQQTPAGQWRVMNVGAP